MFDKRISYSLRAGIAAFIFGTASSLFSISVRAQNASSTGKVLFEKRCSGCHALDRDKEGPRLGGVFGRDAGSIPGFGYSAALQKSKLKWGEETLDKWLTDPEKLVPENDMTFHVERADERREIIAYLKLKSGK